jgi:hypothetical protein
MVASTDYSHLRHLLQSADPIPAFSTLPDEHDPTSFLREWLVRRGPRATRVQRRRDLDGLLRSFGNHRATQERIIEVLQGVNLERTKEIEALSAFTSTASIISGITRASARVLARIERSFETLLAGKEAPSAIAPGGDFSRYCGDPTCVTLDFEARMADAGRLGLRHAPEIVFLAMTRAFSVEAFRSERDGLEAMDREATKHFRSKQGEFIEKFVRAPLVSRTAGGFNMEGWVMEKVMKMEDEAGLLDALRGAFDEGNPLRKMRQVEFAFRQAIEFVGRDLPAGQMIGGDQITPILFAYVIVANPEHLVSNWVFIREFCVGVNVLFGSIAINALAILDTLVREERGVSAGRLVKSQQ